MFPGIAEADEHDWQALVVRHLRLNDWERLVFHDELDAIGPIAREHLVDHGVVWPPTIGADAPLVEVARGGSLIDGEGGDEVLGDGAHRVAPLAALLERPRPLRWRRVRWALGAVAPEPVRRRHERRRQQETATPWLRPAAKDGLVAAVERDEVQTPLSFAASVRRVPRRRSQVLGAHNRRILAQRHDVDVSSPFLHPEVVHALARAGGMMGPGNRTSALRALVADLLPDAVLARTGKAWFNRCYIAQPTRDFASRWTGEGVDPELVDVEELRRAWLADPAPAPVTALVQQAWLATEGLTVPRK
jgi:asparagine synthase (glutamine-hydrolysing)